jgi:hypothetical protein
MNLKFFAHGWGEILFLKPSLLTRTSGDKKAK